MPLADGVNVGDSGNTLLEGLIAGVRWSSGGATTQIKVHIASAQAVSFGGTPAQALAVQQAETNAVNQMLAIYEAFLNVDFVVATNLADADIFVAFVNEADPTIAEEPGTLGIATFPETTANFQGGVLINRDAYQNGTTGLVQGGYDFITFIHEFGHALGLAHSHDDGGTSTVFPGVTPNQAEGSFGNFNLNQGIYTMMSYNDGWRTGPLGPLDPAAGFNRGFEGTPMALDIAALQFMYGANAAQNAGNTVYTLPAANAPGSFYSSIWDTGRTDEIRNTSNTASIIDLRAATLAVANGGGGFVSYVNGIHGGVTIANTVVIENATGGGGADTIYGNDAANIINGGGGGDRMEGFAGADWYYVDSAADLVVEAAAGRSDRVLTSISYTLGASAQIELFTTTNAAGTGALNLIGNGFAQTIAGNAGANILDGNGGADNMQGFAGDDWYYVDSTADVVLDGVGQGTDRVFASASIVLTAGAEIEILSTNNGAGTAAINFTGNAFSQSIGGNAGNNVLYGGGGNDSMVGFGGDDRYFVDSLGDSVVEQAGGGSDRVSTAISYTLTSGQEIELFTTTNSAGLDAIDLTGNNLVQSIGGNAGDNVLNGRQGNDTLTGFGGADTFFFNTALGATNIDRIADFSVADDTIRLENAIFAGLATGALATGTFNTGAAATQADDRIIYNATTGALIFDADGLNGNAGIQFATLNAGLALTSADFFVV